MERMHFGARGEPFGQDEPFQTGDDPGPKACRGLVGIDVYEDDLTFDGAGHITGPACSLDRMRGEVDPNDDSSALIVIAKPTTGYEHRAGSVLQDPLGSRSEGSFATCRGTRRVTDGDQNGLYGNRRAKNRLPGLTPLAGGLSTETCGLAGQPLSFERRRNFALLRRVDQPKRRLGRMSGVASKSKRPRPRLA